MEIKKRANIIFTVVIVSILVLVVGIIYRMVRTEDRLSESEIVAMRERYPICGIDVPETISMIEVPLETFIADENYDSFVYGEVLGDIESFSKEISTGHIELDEKFKSNGLGISVDYYGYVVSVIEDTEGRYQEGDLITIVDNVIFKDYNPTFAEGMKVVVPILENDASINREWFGAVGAYYVTDDGYVISAYDETTRLTRSALSGVKVENLLDELSEMIE